MTTDKSFTDTDTLGDFLRKTRLDKGLDLEQLSNRTKIPLPVLRAMESDDHKALPAKAFARGFYNLYAKTLYIKPEELRKRCADIPNHPLNNDTTYHPQHLTSDVTNLAKKPSVPIFSLLGTVLVFLLMLFALLCWVFSWNPAEYLSKQLKKLETNVSLQQPEQQTLYENVTEDRTTVVDQVPEKPQTFAEKTEAGSTTNNITTQPPFQTGYTLSGSFAVQTTVAVTIDDEDPKEIQIQAGESKTWSAAQSITISLPSTSGVSLILNEDIPITLPTGKPAVISIPEYFFD